MSPLTIVLFGIAIVLVVLVVALWLDGFSERRAARRRNHARRQR